MCLIIGILMCVTGAIIEEICCCAPEVCRLMLLSLDIVSALVTHLLCHLSCNEVEVCCRPSEVNLVIHLLTRRVVLSVLRHSGVIMKLLKKDILYFC